MIKIKLNENQLNEQVIGAQAFVYHGSRTPPDKFVPFFENGTFDPGNGAGAMYGKGLYCVYNFPNTNTSRGSYGQYVYRFKINLYGFIIFNPDIAEKVYGKRLNPMQQVNLLGKNQFIHPLGMIMIDKSNKKEEEQGFSSGYAIQASKFLRGKVKGIVFTGRHDGDVAVIYDESIATLTSYADVNEENFSWKPIDLHKIKKQLKHGLKTSFEEDKYKQKYDFNETEFHDPISVTGRDARKIKEGSIFHKDLVIANASDKDIPKNIKVYGDLVIDGSYISELPDGLHVNTLFLKKCDKLKHIKNNIKITNGLVISECNNLISISCEELNFEKSGNISIIRCPNLQIIPNKIILKGGDLIVLHCEKLKKLPDYLICSNILILNDNKEHRLNLPKYLYLNNPSEKLQRQIIEPTYLWDEFVARIREDDIPQYNMLSKKYGKYLENVETIQEKQRFLAEMPIKNYQTIGNFEKPGAFKGPDQKLMNHPGYIRKLERFFSRSRYDMNFWMSHKPGMRREREQGIISPEKVRELFPKEADAILKEGEDAITIIFLGNYGDNKVMMTPWIVAHRMGHAFQASSRFNKKNTPGDLWKEMEQSIFKEIHDMMRDKYGLLPYNPFDRYNPELNDSYRQIFEAIGTSKSARDKNLPRPYEFLYECLAQFIMSGEIKFNPMPQRIGAGKKTFGRYQSSYRWNGTDEERKEFADDLADLMTWRMDDILSGSLNDIFLM